MTLGMGIRNGEKLTEQGRGFGRKELLMTDEAIAQRVRNATKRIEHRIPDFKVDLQADSLADILTNCLVVVLGFSGARIGEAASFNKDSVDKVMVNGKPVTLLTGETSKGLMEYLFLPLGNHTLLQKQR
jgi:hypothetical protein